MKTVNYVLAFVIMLSSYAVNAQTSEVNINKSSIEWLGKKIGGEHSGNIQLKSGELEISNDKISKGNFVIDMTSITNSDLEDEGYKKKIVDHLKSDDFFGVEKYPTAKFVITKSSKFIDGKAAIAGDITIKGKSESITIKIEREGNEYTAKIDIDRSKFDVKYGSNSFFDNLGDKAIDNIFTLKIKLVLN